MKASYKMMGVILCGVMLLASSCGAKAGNKYSFCSGVGVGIGFPSGVESGFVESASEDASESEAVSETASEASSVVGEAMSEGYRQNQGGIKS